MSAITDIPSWQKRGAPGVGGRKVQTRELPVPNVRSGFMLSNLMRPQSAYDAAAFSSRNVIRPEFGPASALIGSLDVLRGACDHEIRNNGIASKSVNSAAANIGSFRIRTPFNDLQRLFDDWQDECLTSGMLGFEGSQFAVTSAAIGRGDCFVRFRERADGDMRTVPLQMQLIDAAQVPSGKNGTSDLGNDILAGIEFNKIGQRFRYWMFPRHPLDGMGVMSSGGNLMPRPVDGRDVLHILYPRRLDLDVRGEPWLARNLVKMSDLATYDDAEVLRKGAAAQIGGFITFSSAMAANEGKDILSRFGSSMADGSVEFGPGSFPVLPPGWTMTPSQPADVGGQYEAFMRTQYMLCAIGMDLTYEQLTGDWRGANDRTYRASMLEFVRLLRVWQGWIIQQFIKPVWRRFVTTAYVSGRWNPPEGSDPLDWFQCEITPDARGYINPLQEVEAYEKAVLAGFTSRRRVTDELGVDMMKVDIENAKAMLQAGAQNLTYTTHQNPLVAGFDPQVVSLIRDSVVKDLMKAIQRMRADASDSATEWGDGDA